MPLPRRRLFSRDCLRPVVALLLAVSAAALVGLAAATALLLAANGRERQARELAREEEARTQRDQAVKNFQLARQAVKEYCTRIGTHRLLNLREMEGLRKELLGAAVPFYQEFVRQKSDDPDLRADQGGAHYDLGSISSAAARADPRLFAADRDARGEQYAGRAVELLRRARAACHEDADALRKDADLDPLRKRANFQKLLDQLNAIP